MIIEAMQHVGKYLLSATLGAFILYWFFWPEFTENTEIVEVRSTDTVYVTIRDTVRITKVKNEYLRDTILSKPIQPQIKAFTASTPFLYGNTYVNGEVLGEVLKIDITNDFKIPTVTNTINRTVTNTITEKPRGLYVGASINSGLRPAAQLLYLDKQYIFSGSYSLDRTISIGVSKKLF